MRYKTHNPALPSKKKRQNEFNYFRGISGEHEILYRADLISFGSDLKLLSEFAAFQMKSTIKTTKKYN